MPSFTLSSRMNVRLYDIYYYTHLFPKKGYILFTVLCQYLSVSLQNDDIDTKCPILYTV